MIPENISRTDPFQVHWYDTDCFGRLTFPGFARFLEESAWLHANELGFGLNDTQEAGVVWVIVRLEIDIYRIPRWGDEVQVKTWPRGVDRLFAYREFEVWDHDGGVLAKATSTWIVLDRLERKAVKPAIVESILPYVDKRMVLERNARRIPVSGEKKLVASRQVVFSDLDTNGHVNNCKYLEWVVDLMDYELLKNLHKCSICLNFVSELLYLDGVDIYCFDASGSMAFEGIAKSTGKSVFVICIGEGD
ncbi:MAG: acyl-[acyl-carrier-protein] thioesterase [Breznakibacter sp.]